MQRYQQSLPLRSSLSFSNILVAVTFLLALIIPTFAVPLRSSTQVPDHWAQLLYADRFKLIRSPRWVTRGYQSNPRLNTSLSELSATVEKASDDDSSEANPPQLHLTPTVRQQIYQSQRDKSQFTCHVFNKPPNVNLDPVIRRVLVIASQAWESSQEVVMKVDFQDLGEPSHLASGGGTYFVRMSDTFDTVLPVAAAEAMRGEDLNGNKPNDGKYDVLTTINSRTQWYDGTDGSPPSDRYDLITVLLHEIYHNLVFAGSVTATTERIPNSNNAIQSASIHNGYRTRFDAFLMNSENCAVLGYLDDQQLSQQLNRPNNQLLADAVCNDLLYWGYGNQKIAKLFSPRIFQQKSSIYHFDPATEGEENRLMFPTVRIGSATHGIGPKIISMQRITLDPNIPGANTGCPRPLKNPTPKNPIAQNDYNEPPNLFDGQPLVLQNRYELDDRNRIGGLPVWAFALLIVFAILLALLLLGLCLALLLKALRRRAHKTSRSSSSSIPSTKQGPATRTSSSSRSRPYIPGVGGSVSKSKKSRTSASSRTSRMTTSVQPTSKHTSASRKTSSKHTTEPKPVTERTSSRRHITCPSTGKSKYLCCCKCCKSSITPPPPVASVHTFDPECVPTSHKHKSTHKSRGHKHIYSCQKTVKKSCKRKSLKSCSCACYCCRYKPSSCKTSTTCCKSISTGSSSKCRPTSSTPPSTKPPSTKVASSSKHCCSAKHCTSKYSSSKSCSCAKSSSKVPSTKPPSTKPPTKVASASKSCRTCKASCKTCKPSGHGCACNRCEQVVEVNIC